VTATYDTSTDIGKVRLYIGDTDVTPSTDAVFSDEELQIFLDSEGTVCSAAAFALETIASSQARTAGLMKTMNWTQDTRGVAADLRKQAEALRDKDGAAFGFAEIAQTPQVAAQIIVNKALRDAG